MKNKCSREEAQDILYLAWENGILPSNFTEGNSDYEQAIIYVMENGYFDFTDFYYGT